MTDHHLLERALRSPRYDEVRRRLFRQLVESLVYEGVLTPSEEPDGRSAVVGADERGAPVTYSFSLAEPALGFARTRLGTDPVLRSDGEETGEAQSLTRFLIEVQDQLGATPERVAGFARELEETLLKDTVAQYVRTSRGDVLNGADHEALEGTLMDGHPYHPAYKSRIGFDLQDHLTWGPEFQQSIRPLWLAAHRRITRVHTSRRRAESAFLKEQLGDHLDTFHRTLSDQGLDPADYTLLPVHPWQWRETVAVNFAEQVRNREIVALGDDPHHHRAQQSIRTLSCVDEPRRAYSKLSLSILNTSTSRVLAPHTVANAARVSDWLWSLVESDPYLRDELRVILLKEVQGTAVVPEPVSELVRGDTYGTLACVWRESLESKLDDEEQAVPYTALIAREADGTPFVDPWIKFQGVETWLRRLLEVSVVPLVHLLQGHGVAVESHAQNMVLVHRGGVPSRVALRDFHDGVRFSRVYLARPELCPPLEATPPHHGNRNSFVETDDLDLVRDFFLDAFFFINLGELAMFLAAEYDYPEEDFWAATRDTIAAYQQRFPELADRFELFDVGTPELEVEQLTARRLLPDTELRLHSVPNPLHRPTTTDRKG